MSFQCRRDIYFCSQAQAQVLRAAVGCSGASPACPFWIISIQAEACLNHLVSVWNTRVCVGSALGNFSADSRAADTCGRVQMLLEHVIQKCGGFLFLARGHSASEEGSIALELGLQERAFVAQAYALAGGQGRPDHFLCSVLN